MKMFRHNLNETRVTHVGESKIWLNYEALCGEKKKQEERRNSKSEKGE